MPWYLDIYVISGNVFGEQVCIFYHSLPGINEHLNRYNNLILIFG